jgi:nucleoid-associated protein YgaU
MPGETLLHDRPIVPAPPSRALIEPPPRARIVPKPRALAPLPAEVPAIALSWPPRALFGKLGGASALALVAALVLAPHVGPARARQAALAPPHAAATVAPARAYVAPTPVPRAHPRFIRVARGDSLWAIARARLGDGRRWTELWRLNRGARLRDPDVLEPGWRLRLPAKT